MNDTKLQVTDEVTLSDLKVLGMQGGASAILLNGHYVRLGKYYGFIKRIGIVSGEMVDVEIIESYHKLYAQIRTIKRDGILVARRVKRGQQSKLLLTGQGYKRKTLKK